MELDPELFPPMHVIPAGGMNAIVPIGDPRPPSAFDDYDPQLIADLVANMRFQKDILAQYHITPEQLAAKMLNPAFAAHYRDSQRVWNSEMNSEERIRAKAKFFLEQSMPELAKIATNPQMPVSAKLGAIEQLTKISTVAHIARGVEGEHEQHKITINIGTGQPTTIISQKESE